MLTLQHGKSADFIILGNDVSEYKLRSGKLVLRSLISPTSVSPEIGVVGPTMELLLLWFGVVFEELLSTVSSLKLLLFLDEESNDEEGETAGSSGHGSILLGVREEAHLRFTLHITFMDELFLKFLTHCLILVTFFPSTAKISSPGSKLISRNDDVTTFELRDSTIIVSLTLRFNYIPNLICENFALEVK